VVVDAVTPAKQVIDEAVAVKKTLPLDLVVRGASGPPS
jgi:hypothetical protein